MRISDWSSDVCSSDLCAEQWREDDDAEPGNRLDHAPLPLRLQVEIPAHQYDHPNQHDEGIMVDVTGLKQARTSRQAARHCGDAVWPDAVDHRAVARFPEPAADIEGRANENAVVELVEVPLMEGDL